jgi:hypothetical protein
MQLSTSIIKPFCHLTQEFLNLHGRGETNYIMRLAKLPVVLVLVSVFACFSFGRARAESESGLEGVITVSPIHPGPLKAGAPSSAPFAKASFVVESEKGVVASFTTDDAGRFRISLAPGHYKVTRKGEKPAIGHFGPFEVDVVAGKMTKVEWECDTGTR